MMSNQQRKLRLKRLKVMQNHTRNAKDLSGDAQSTDNTTEKQQEVENNNSNQETLTTNNQTTKILIKFLEMKM